MLLVVFSLQSVVSFSTVVKPKHTKASLSASGLHVNSIGKQWGLTGTKTSFWVSCHSHCGEGDSSLQEVARPPETWWNDTFTQTRTHRNHSRTIIRLSASNWLAWLRVNSRRGWGGGRISQRWGAEDLNLCVCVFGIKDTVSRWAVCRVNSQLPACEARAVCSLGLNDGGCCLLHSTWEIRAKALTHNGCVAVLLTPVFCCSSVPLNPILLLRLCDFLQTLKYEEFQLDLIPFFFLN